MNILMLTGTYPQPDDGEVSATYTVQYFCEQWVRQGHNVLVIHNSSRFPIVYYLVAEQFSQKLASKVGANIPKIHSRKKIERFENGIQIFRIPMFKVIPHSPFSKKQIQNQAKQIISILNNSKFQPEIILSHWVNPQLDLLIELKKIYPVKTSIVFHGDCSENCVQKFDIMNKIQEVDAVGCRSLTYAKEVKERLGLTKLPFICYSGVPDDLVEYDMNTIVQKKRRHFVYVGRLVKYKNIDAIIKALVRAFPDKEFLLDIVGTGGELDNLKRLVKETNCEDVVFFHGQVSRERAFEIMNKAECFTMISSNEVFGMVYIEAMAKGCITIASKYGGVDGIIIDGENGFLCEEGSVEELAKIYEKIDKMYEYEKKQISLNAMNTARNFADSRVAEQYLKEVLDWRS